MPLKQVLEAEKKIRRLGLLQQYVLLAASQLHLNNFHLPRWIKIKIQRILK